MKKDSISALAPMLKALGIVQAVSFDQANALFLELREPVMTTCDDCKHRTGWRTAFVATGPEKMVVADCMHPDWPEWWKARNERPIVSPGAGSACKKYERHERPNDKGEQQ